MEIKPIAPGFAVAPQITPGDVARAVEAGYKTIICNRPDGEDVGQPTAAQIADAARAAGVEFRFLPLVPGMSPTEIVHDFEDALTNCAAPILAYCRTGTRCTTLWALSRAKQQSPDEILAAAAQAGYDLSMLRPLMEQAFQAAGEST